MTQKPHILRHENTAFWSNCRTSYSQARQRESPHTVSSPPPPNFTQQTVVSYDVNLRRVGTPKERVSAGELFVVNACRVRDNTVRIDRVPLHCCWLTLSTSVGRGKDGLMVGWSTNETVYWYRYCTTLSFYVTFLMKKKWRAKRKSRSAECNDERAKLIGLTFKIHQRIGGRQIGSGKGRSTHTVRKPTEVPTSLRRHASKVAGK